MKLSDTCFWLEFVSLSLKEKISTDLLCTYHFLIHFQTTIINFILPLLYSTIDKRQWNTWNAHLPLVEIKRKIQLLRPFFSQKKFPVLDISREMFEKLLRFLNAIVKIKLSRTHNNRKQETQSRPKICTQNQALQQKRARMTNVTQLSLLYRRSSCLRLDFCILEHILNDRTSERASKCLYFFYEIL